MKIKRVSVLTGITRELDIPVDPNDLVLWELGMGSIHEVLPYLSAGDREYILCGITPEEWQAAISEQGGAFA